MGKPRPVCSECRQEMKPIGGVLRPGKRAYQCVEIACSRRFKDRVERVEKRDDLDADGWPKRWSDPTYLGDGPWGA